MRLSLEIIRDMLGDLVIKSNITEEIINLNLSRPVFYTEENLLNSDTLYISESKALPENIEIKSGSSLICISTPPDYYFNKNLNLLVIDNSVNILDLGNKLNNIYNIFDDWDSKLKQSLSEKNPLQYIIDFSEHVFGNGISIMDSNYFIIGQTKLNLNSAYGDNSTDEFGLIPSETVNSFKNERLYREISKEKNVFKYYDEVLPYNCLCKNIFLNEEFLFRIIISETDRKFKACDKVLLDYLSTYLEKIADQLYTMHQEKNSILTSYLQNIILGNSINYSEFESELKKIGWNHKDTYSIVYIQPSSHDIYITTMYYFCSKIMHEFKHTFSFLINNLIIVIINIDKLSLIKDDFFNNFNYFIREGNFRAGFSNYAKGLANLKEYSLQAKLALNIGIIQEPTKWSHKFSDYVFNYILNKITEELPSEFLCSPIILRLQKHDHENQTDYVKTLRVYLSNNMNAVQTSKDLFIHRATIIYRIDRIKEIGKADLKNPDELLYLKLSFKLIK